MLMPTEQIRPVPSTLQGTDRQEPLTFERFRICELYAELLHCSNMAILNRPAHRGDESSTPAPSYDSISGRITGTRKQAFERLGNALNGTDSVSESSPDLQQEGMPNGDGTTPVLSTEEGEDRPVTAQSDVTSSYTSGASEISDTKEDSEDVFDGLTSATEGLSLDDDASSLHFASSNPPSTTNSPMPPASAQFGSLASPQKPASLPNGDVSPGPSLSIRAALSQQTQKKADAPALLPGQALKRAFIDLQVVPAVLDLFFRFPWNNFLHNVVYDLVQQIFNGKLEIGLNRELCLAVFKQQNGLIDRLLNAAEENSKIMGQPNGVRLGHMGHLTLISEEVIKLFYDSTNDLLSSIPEHTFDRARWETFVEGTLRETRERDLQPLGGGISVAMHGSVSTGSAGGVGIVDIDDEFPTSGQPRSFFSAEGEGSGSPGTSPDKAHFARYLESQISSDLPGQAGKNSLNLSTSSSSSSSSGSSSSDEAQGHADYQGSPSRRQSSGLDNAAATWFSVGNEGDSAFDDYDDDDEGTSALGSKSAKKAREQDGAHTAQVSQTRRIHDSTAGISRQERFGFDVSIPSKAFRLSY